MAFNSAEWTINYTAKTVTNNDSGTGDNVPATTGNQTYVGTCLLFFQWLAGDFAASAQMDDSYPIVSDTPTVYKWQNGWAFGHADDTKYLTGGDFTSSDGLEFWASVFTIGAPVAGTQIYIFQNDAELTPWWDTDNIDVLIKVKAGGTFIQSDDVSGTPKDGGIWLYTREYGDFYNHGFVDLEAGRAPIGIDTAVDTNNETLEATIQGYYDDASFTVTFGTVSRDLNNGEGAQNYDVEVDCNGLGMADVYEVLKLATQYGNTVQLNGADGQVYRSASHGTYAEVKVAPFGTLAGTTFFGARGVWLTNYLAADFKLIDAANISRSPPSLQKVNCNHPSLVGTNILVAESSAGAVIKNQYTIASVTTNSITGDGSPSLDADKIPLTGFVKIGDVKYAYTSWTGEVFSGVTPDPTGETGNFYVPLLDVLADTTTELSDNVVYNSSFTVLTSVRKYGFKPYDVETTFGSGGLTFTPILATDPQAT
jgi:hypothetical protein